jgi:hypothetical protein
MVEVEAIPGRGRTIKFTPERIDQIKNLVERGTKREEIAEIIGCTLGSLQVTCSRLGISLRRPREIYNMPVRRPIIPALTLINGSEVKMPNEPTIELSLVLRFNGREKVTTIKVPVEVFTRLWLKATCRDMSVTELISEILKRA